MRRLILLLAAVSSVYTSDRSRAQPQPSSQSVQIDVRRFMSAGELKDAGLDKLSPKELDALNRWLGRFAVQLLQAAHGGSDGCQTAIESQIDGTFRGWSGDTIFKLTNGQIWQQSSYAYTYHYAYRPEVTIFVSGGGCNMKVEGVSDSISVK